MFVTMKSELQCLKEQGTNCNVCNDKDRITMFVRKTSKLQCL